MHFLFLGGLRIEYRECWGRVQGRQCLKVQLESTFTSALSVFHLLDTTIRFCSGLDVTSGTNIV